MSKVTFKQEDDKTIAICCGKKYNVSALDEFLGHKVPKSNIDASDLSNDVKEILEDAKDGRVKKSTRKKINDLLD